MVTTTVVLTRSTDHRRREVPVVGHRRPARPPDGEPPAPRHGDRPSPRGSPERQARMLARRLLRGGRRRRGRPWHDASRWPIRVEVARAGRRRRARPSRAARASCRCRGRARRPPSRARFCSSFATRVARRFEHLARRHAARRRRRRRRRRRSTSPGFTSMPAHTTGTLTAPTVALTVPLALIGAAPDREPHLGELVTSRHARVDHEAEHAVRAERRREQLAEHAVGVRAARRPRRRCRRAARARQRRAASNCRRGAAAR